jgi:hypothetical protein
MSQAKNESENQKKFGSQIWIWQFSAKTRFGCQIFWSQYDFYEFRKQRLPKPLLAAKIFFGNQKWFWQASTNSKMQ